MANKKLKIRKKLSQERMLFGIAILLFLFVLIVFALALNFLRDTILPAFSSENLNNGEEIHFNLKGFEELDL